MLSQRQKNNISLFLLNRRLLRLKRRLQLNKLLDKKILELFHCLQREKKSLTGMITQRKKTIGTKKDLMIKEIKMRTTKNIETNLIRKSSRKKEKRVSIKDLVEFRRLKANKNKQYIIYNFCDYIFIFLNLYKAVLYS